MNAQKVGQLLAQIGTAAYHGYGLLMDGNNRLDDLEDLLFKIVRDVEEAISEIANDGSS